MTSFCIQNGVIYGENTRIENGFLEVFDERITSIGRCDELIQKKQTVFRLPPQWKVVPGFIDLHIHGALGADVMDGNVAALETIGRALPKEGTTSFLATTMTAPIETIEKALRNINKYIGYSQQEKMAELIGIHLEGPFLSKEQRGAQPEEFILNPDLPLFQKWQVLSGHAIRLVTLAPELGSNQLINEIVLKNGVVSIGHSHATYQQALEGIQQGITHATHLFNGMRGLHHRQPGVVGAVLLASTVSAELIVDGIHCCPEMIDLAYRLKGKDQLILVTDAIRAKGLGDGTYELANQPVCVAENKAVLSDGTLAGSTLTMIDAIKNMMTYTNCAFEEALQMATFNPAKQVNMVDQKGSLTRGKVADIVVLDEEFQIMMTFCRGKLAYKHQKVDFKLR